MQLVANKWIILGAVLLVVLVGGGVYFWQTQTTEAIPFETMSVDDAPALVYDQYEKQKAGQCFSINSYDGSTYVLITMGEANTGGYDVEVTEVAQQNSKWVIHAKLVPPAPDSFVIMAITYPAIVVKLPQTVTKLSVFANGQELLQF